MRKGTQVLVTVAFALSVGTPLAATTTGVRQGKAIENRALTPRPPLGGSALFHAQTFKDLDAYVTERLPWRDQAVRAREQLSLELFDEPFTDQVTVGRDGWRFLGQGVRRPCITTDELARMRSALTEVTALLAAAGKPFHLLMAPDKEAVYPQYLRSRDLRSSCVVANAAAAAALTDGVEPGRSRVWEESRSGPLLYYRADTHWNQRGATIAARDLVEAVDPGTFDERAYTVTVDGDLHPDDLLTLLGIPGTEVGDRVEIARPGVSVTSSVTVGTPPTESIRQRRVGDGLVPGRVLVVHDSFGLPVQPLAAPWFADVTWSRLPSTELVAGSVVEGLRDADVVVLLVTARNLGVLVPLVESVRATLGG